MNPLLRLSAGYFPTFIKKRQVRKLLHLTAEAFHSTPPSIRGLSFDESLKAFAAFTQHEAEKAIRSGQNLGAIHRALYDRAFELGTQYGKWFRIAGIDEVMSAARVLYGFCGIDFQGTPEGEVTIRRCFFSGYYSSDVCRIISSLDAGLLAGLSGGRRLTFSRRITEGADSCTGHLTEGLSE